MTDVLWILILLFVVAKVVIFGPLLYFVFRDDIRQYLEERKHKDPVVPICMYCQSRWTEPVGEGETRWEGNDLVLVTTYECQHCHMPFWHVERVALPSSGQHKGARVE